MFPAAWAIAIAVALQTAPPVSPSPSASTWSDDRPLTRLFQNLATDVSHLPTTEAAAIVGVGGAGALVAHPLDDNLSTWAIGAGRTSYTRAGGVIGDGWTQAGAAIATYAIGKISHHDEVAHVGGDLIRGQVLNGLMTTVIKVSVNRTRPTGSHHAFPSGHTSATFTSAAVLQKHFGWRVGGAAYAAAGFVGWTRLRDDQHWLSDVVFGAAIGVLAGHTVTVGHGQHVWTLIPTPAPGGAALYIVR